MIGHRAFLLAALLGCCGMVRACADHSDNICTTGKKQCATQTQPWLFSDGREIGLQSTTLTHADMRQGCYCQRARMDVIVGVNGDAFPHALSPDLLVTTCTGDFGAYWNGAHVMNVTGGTLGGNYDVDPGFSYSYDKMVCDQYASDSTAETLVPNSGGAVHLLDWTTAAPLPLEVTLPANVAFFNTSNDACPGNDVQDGFHANTHVATALTAAQVQNCSCSYSASAAIGDSGAAEGIDGNAFWTVCDSAMRTYFNGKGFRTARDGASEGGDLVSDYCHSTMTAGASRVAYVKPPGSSSGGGGGGGGSSGGGGGGDQNAASQLNFARPWAYGAMTALLAVAALQLQ